MITNSASGVDNLPRLRRVSILENTWAGSSSEIIAGIGSYLRVNRRWVVQRRDASEDIFERVKAFAPEGVIASISDEMMEQRLLELGVPVINVNGAWQTEAFPRIDFDAIRAGQMQVDHLRSQGHWQFAFVGALQIGRNSDLLKGAEERLKELKLPLEILDLNVVRTAPYSEWSFRVRQWIADLEKPVGILTPLSEDAENVAQRCHQLQVSIPEKVSIITLNNDQIAASLAYPEFTTVNVPWHLLGFQAARQLDSYMKTGYDNRESTPGIVALTGITTRRSTDSLVIEDPDLAKALAYIRSNASGPITVNEVATACGLSRRVLEKRFARTISHSPFDEIRAQQLNWVKTLLVHSDKSIEGIVEQTAFANASHLGNAFRQSEGISPGAYRQYFRRD